MTAMRGHRTGRGQNARADNTALGHSVAQTHNGVGIAAQIGHRGETGLQRDLGILRTTQCGIGRSAGKAGGAITIALLAAQMDVAVDKARQDKLVREVHNSTFTHETVADFLDLAILDHQRLPLGHAARGRIGQYATGMDIGHVLGRSSAGRSHQYGCQTEGPALLQVQFHTFLLRGANGTAP